MTSLQQDTESLEELFTCTICFNRYDAHFRLPMLLPCQHSICSVCLPELLKYTTLTKAQQDQGIQHPSPYIQCPFCNKRYSMNVSDVPKNRIISQLLEASHGNLQSLHQSPAASSSITTGARSYNMPSAPAPDYDLLTRPVAPARPFRVAPPPPPPQRSQPPPEAHWDESDYLKKLFRDVDVNGDGTITFNELHNALVRGQLSTQFDIKTAELLVNKYDTNGDHEINFNEFQNLFTYLNEEYFKFIMADADGSGTIDSGELEEFLRQRGHTFQREFCSFIIDSIKTKTKQGVTFDYYCRLMARFDYLVHMYSNTQYYKTSSPLEDYLRKTFFTEFW